MEYHHWIQSREGKKISLVAHIPNEQGESKFPTLVYAHGFTGNKIGDNRMGIDLARFLCGQGFVVIRFDYVGSGESEGDFETYTHFSGWLEDIQHVLDWVENFEHTNKTKIGLIGHSFSGAIVTYLSTIRPNIQSICALAPVFYLQESFRHTIIGNELWESALAGEVMKDFYHKKFSLSPFFVKDLPTYQMEVEVPKVTIPTCIIHGKKDGVLSFQDSIDFEHMLTTDMKKLILFEEEEHLFSHQIHEPILAWFNETINSSK